MSGFHKVWFVEREIQETMEFISNPTAYKILAPKEDVSMFESADFTIEEAVAPRKDDENAMAALIGMDITAPIIVNVLFVLSRFK